MVDSVKEGTQLGVPPGLEISLLKNPSSSGNLAAEDIGQFKQNKRSPCCPTGASLTQKENAFFRHQT